MTIGLGFACNNGIVLCADRQLTSSEVGFKFEESKFETYQRSGLNYAFTYAGSKDAALHISRKLRSTLSSATETARTLLEQVFYDSVSEEVEILIGIQISTAPPQLFRTSGKKVLDGRVEYIGCGDSSALRYLTSFLNQEEGSTDEASVLGSYIVSVANRFIDGCSGGPDRVVLYNDGKIMHGTGGVFPNQRERFLYCEQEVGRHLRCLLFRGGIDQPDNGK